MSKRIRVVLLLLAIIPASLLLLDGIMFRLIILFGLLCAAMELVYSRLRRIIVLNDEFCQLMAVFIMLSVFFFCVLAEPRVNVIVVAGVCSCDVFAYIFGRVFGGKIFSSRPFPHTSPNKSWEGIIAGVISSACVVSATIYIYDGFTFGHMLPMDAILYGCGIFAVIGDYLESRYKRSCRVKDSCEFIPPTNNIMLAAEGLLGGAEGHGGYLDRLDSLIFTGAILFFTYAPFSHYL